MTCSTSGLINKTVVLAGAVLCVLSAHAHAGYLAYNVSDFSNQVLIYDTTAHSVISTWFPDGAISDIAIDPLSGTMYAAAQGGVYSRAITGGPTTWLGIAGFTTNYGGDLRVLGNYLVINQNDLGNNVVQVYDKTTHSLLSTWSPDGAISDIAIDPLSGTMYAAAQGGIYRRAITGGPTTWLGLIGFAVNYGGDLDISGNQLLVNANDLGNTQVLVYDKNTLALISTWTPDGPISDVIGDAATGVMYAATSNGIYSRAITGGPTTWLGIVSFPFNQGGDLAYYSPPTASSVPEPSSFALLGIGLVGLGTLRLRRERNVSGHSPA